ncbi:MAG: UDP-N-acetylmuramate--L-alanine ligase [bacterium]|nr:UDP-N-acetylmuramate--L-alanine ligase [bacterium]
MNLHELKSVHFVGVGGINMSAVAKLLLHAGISVSGSDIAENEQTQILAQKGATIHIGESADHIPEGCELIIVTSAAPVTNVERAEAQERRISEMTNFTFLGEWFKDSKTIVVAGTHGKSTTTAMLGLALETAGMDPTVVVGSVVPGFQDGNLRIGKSDLFVVEGDEYAHHFLEFDPFGLVLTNIELDHVDVFSSINSLLESFHELVQNVRSGGLIVANVSDERVQRLMETEKDSISKRGITVVSFTDQKAIEKPFQLQVPGQMNRMNATSAFLMAEALGAPVEKITESLEAFRGIWRRFEFLGERDGYRVYSDYGHHPTAVESTLKATRELFPDSRIVLCFQPHHRNRTKALFNDFVTSFDLADVLVLAEIYAVSGRDEDSDQDISSQKLVTEIHARDFKMNRDRIVKNGGDPEQSVRMTFDLAKKGDVVIVMGAGDIDSTLRKMMNV